jgi:cation:H+ antiporter
MVRIALTARLRYGPDMTSAPTYVATAAHADHATMQFVDPGEVSSPYTLGDGSIEVARSQEVSEAIIGLTVVAIGTTAPELVTTLVSTIRGDRDIAIGNLLGSSVYNIAVILGITILMAPSALMIPPEVVAADLLFLAVATVITVPVLLSGQRMTRVEGGAFVVGYVGYLLWLVLA